MSTAKVIGKVQVSLGNVKIVDAEGKLREINYEDFLYEGEQLYSDNPNALFQIKYLNLSEATVYEGVFKVLANGSVISGLDGNENLFGNDIEFLDTAAGEQGKGSSSAFLEELSSETSSQLLQLDRGTDDSGFGVGITNVQSDSEDITDQTPPVITSTNTIIYDENSTSSVIQVKAEDTSAVTFSIEAGLDSSLFTIDPISGVITFNSSPDYETPQDLGLDNEYNISVTVTDAHGNLTTQLLSINVNNLNDNVPVTESGTNSAIEDGVSISGQLVGSDADGDAIVFIQTSDVAEGTLKFSPDGSYAFAVGDDFQDLALGETREVTFTFKVVESQTSEAFESAHESIVTITVTGANDAPTVVSELTSVVRGEDAGWIKLNVLANDYDVDSNHNNQNVEISAYSTEFLSSSVASLESSDFRLDNLLVYRDRDDTKLDFLRFKPNASFDKLATGDEVELKVHYTVTDDLGASSDGYALVTVVGTNDAPIVKVDYARVTENESFTVDVLANDTDKDHNDNSSNFSLDSVDKFMIKDSNGNWVSLDANAIDATIVANKLEVDLGSYFDYLTQGETIKVRIYYSMSDDEGLANTNSKNYVNLTIKGTNDQPEVSDIDAANGSIEYESDTGLNSFIGTIPNAQDLDTGATHLYEVVARSVEINGVEAPEVLVSIYENLITKEWEYKIEGDFNYLAKDEKATVTFQYVADDQTNDSYGESNISDSATVTLIITGTNEIPVANNEIITIMDNVAVSYTPDNATELGLSVTASYDGKEDPSYLYSSTDWGVIIGGKDDGSMSDGESLIFNFNGDVEKTTFNLSDWYGSNDTQDSANDNSKGDAKDDTENKDDSKGESKAGNDAHSDDLIWVAYDSDGNSVNDIYNGRGSTFSIDSTSIAGLNNISKVEITAYDDDDSFKIASIDTNEFTVVSTLSSFIIDDASLLANDTDADGNILSIELVDGNSNIVATGDLFSNSTVIGEVTIDANGDIQVTPDASYQATSDAEITFDYIVVDEHGQGSEVATATINLKSNTVENTAYDSVEDNVLIIDTGTTLDLSNVSDISIIQLNGNATLHGSDALLGITASDVIESSDDGMLIINSLDDGADNGVAIDSGSLTQGDNISINGTEYFSYSGADATLLVEIDIPIDVD